MRRPRGAVRSCAQALAKRARPDSFNLGKFSRAKRSG
jgi:hypothetical protein